MWGDHFARLWLIAKPLEAGKRVFALAGSVYNRLPVKNTLNLRIIRQALFHHDGVRLQALTLVIDQAEG